VTIAVVGSLGAYAGLFALMFLAWAGLPVAGQPALVAAGVLASRGKLDIGVVLAVATVGSALGGCLGYLLGVNGGRALFTVRGPLHERRARELVRGERLIGKYGPVAVLIAPTWVAGIFEMGWRKFLPWDVIAAVVWTLAAGLGGYFFGPVVTKVLNAANAAVLIAVAVVVVIAAAIYFIRRRRQVADGGDQPTTVP
jgi:membrane protein DedA with SNARE-associated domain